MSPPAPHALGDGVFVPHAPERGCRRSRGAQLAHKRPTWSRWTILGTAAATTGDQPVSLSDPHLDSPSLGTRVSSTMVPFDCHLALCEQNHIDPHCHPKY